jgi:hypothetical protein
MPKFLRAISKGEGCLICTKEDPAAECFMRILIQNCKTKLFLKEDLSWTETIKAALGFGSGTSAIAFYQKLSIEDVQLVYDFDNSAFNFVTPISVSCR